MEVTSTHEVIELDDNADVGMARRRAVLLAQQCGLDEIRVGEVALIVTEAGTNVLRHATAGIMVLGQVRQGATRGLNITVSDRGPGMDILRSLADGFSTIKSAGVGMGAIARLASEWDAYSRRPGGTLLTATVWPRRSTPVPWEFDIGALAIPYPGEQRCGDGWAAVIEDQVCTLLVSDGLGHSGPAADASAAVLASFLARPNAPLTDIIHEANVLARPTRGAAASVARLDRRLGTVEFVGVGNVAGWVISEDHQQAMVGQHGTLGTMSQTVRTVRSSTYPLPDQALVVLHSDGLASRWSLGDYPGLARHRPSVIAGFLWRELGRSRDDATVVVARPQDPLR